MPEARLPEGYDLEKFLQTSGSPLRELINLATGKRDTCILSTKIGIKYLALFGVQAFPLSVKVQIFNDGFLRRLVETGAMPQARDDEWWVGAPGAHSIGIGYAVEKPEGPADPKKVWDGHLVVCVERRFIWDLAIDQAERPDKGIEFKRPPVVPVTEKFIRGHDPKLSLSSEGEHPLAVSYLAIAGDKSWKDSRTWAEHPTQDALVRAAARYWLKLEREEAAAVLLRQGDGTHVDFAGRRWRKWGRAELLRAALQETGLTFADVGPDSLEVS